MTNPTKQDKILAIAKAMHGHIYVFEEVYANGKIVKVGTTNKNKEFNPYTSAEDSQEIQEFFSIGTTRDAQDNWVAYRREANAYSKDIKTAIADCAYEVTKEK